jgi:NaMN:DMB phosphoribosyltransferase
VAVVEAVVEAVEAAIEADRAHMAAPMEVAIGGHIVARMAGIMDGLSIILKSVIIQLAS